MTDREAFEARGEFSKRLLFKRGGSVFAEDVPEGDYVDAGVQHEWLLWREAWQAACKAALEEAAKALDDKFYTSASAVVRAIPAAKE